MFYSELFIFGTLKNFGMFDCWCLLFSCPVSFSFFNSPYANSLCIKLPFHWRKKKVFKRECFRWRGWQTYGKCVQKKKQNEIAFKSNSKGALLTFNFSRELTMEKLRTDVYLSGRKPQTLLHFTNISVLCFTDSTSFWPLRRNNLRAWTQSQKLQLGEISQGGWHLRATG